jgi:GT2 family glycosyltransferase
MTDDEQSKNIVLAIPNRSSSSQINAELANFIHKVGEEQMPESGDYELKVNFSYLQPVDANRNKMVKNFLENEDNEWMLMVDNDVVPPGDILQMVDCGEKVVSATVTVKKQGVPHPVIVKQRDDGKFRRITMEEYHDEISDEGLVEVDGVGTGCLLIHRSVFEEMSPPWFKFVYNEDGTLKLGEDFYFGQRLRQMNQPMYVSSEFVCSHYRKTDLTEFAQIVADAENVSPE